MIEVGTKYRDLDPDYPEATAVVDWINGGDVGFDWCLNVADLEPTRLACNTKDFLNGYAQVPAARTRILFVGHGRHGKDECCARICAHRPDWTNAGTCSVYLAPYVAEQTHQSIEDTYANRHLNRETWKRIGDETRASDPGFLIKQMMACGNIGGGPRGLPEILAAKSLVDLIVWVERPGAPVDPTVDFDKSHADIILFNDGTLADLDTKLERLSRSIR